MKKIVLLLAAALLLLGCRASNSEMREGPSSGVAVVATTAPEPTLVPTLVPTLAPTPVPPPVPTSVPTVTRVPAPTRIPTRILRLDINEVVQEAGYLPSVEDDAYCKTTEWESVCVRQSGVSGTVYFWGAMTAADHPTQGFVDHLLYIGSLLPGGVTEIIMDAMDELMSTWWTPTTVTRTLGEGLLTGASSQQTSGAIVIVFWFSLE